MIERNEDTINPKSVIKSLFLYPTTLSCERGRKDLFLHVECVVHTLLFGEEIAMIVFVGSDFHRHILHNLKTIGFQAHALHRIIGDETHLCHPEVAEYLCSHT